MMLISKDHAHLIETERRECPYCGTARIDRDGSPNGMVPLSGDGCEFCNPESHKESSDTFSGYDIRTGEYGDDWLLDEFIEQDAVFCMCPFCS